MSNVSQITEGGRILGSVIRGIAPLLAFKVLDEHVATGVGVLQDDDNLLLHVEASAVYLWVLFASYTGGAAGVSDLMAGWSLPAGASMVYGRLGIPAGGTAPLFQKTVDTDTVNYATAGGSGTSTLLNVGTLATDGMPGIMQWRWAQNSGTATDTVVKAGSVLGAWKIR